MDIVQKLKNKLASKAAKFEVKTNLHPAIGALMRRDGVHYYTFIGGECIEDTPENLTKLLTAQGQ